MGIAKMNKLYLVAHQAEKDKVLNILQQLGVLEVNDLQAKDAEDQAWAEMVEEDQEQEALQSLEARLADVRFSLDFLQRYYPAKKSMLAALSDSKMVVDSAQLGSNAILWDNVSTGVYTALRKIDEKLMLLRNEETRLQNLKIQLTPWVKLDVPLEEIKTTSVVRTELGTLPAAELGQVREELAAAAPACYLQEINSDRGESFVFVLYHLSSADDVLAVLKQHNFNRQNFPQLQGTAAENLKRIEQELAKAESERTAALAGAAEQLKYRDQLNYFLDYLTLERDKKQVVSNLARTGNAFILEGWICQADLPELKKKLASACETVEVLAREPEEDEAFPVMLENKPLFAPFEFITKLYGTPGPRGLDPTPMLSPFFIVFFGLCMTDAGYGVIIALLGIVGLKMIKAGPARNLMWIFLAGGLSTVLFGWLVGGWFGMPLLGAPLFFDSLADPMRMLIYAFVLGIIQIFFGMAIQFYRLAKQGKILDAIFDVGFWYLLIIGLLLFIAPGMGGIAQSMALVGAGGLILTQGRTQPTLIKKFFSGLLSLYNITGYLSDVLSYSRLLALGLATAVIALAINTMAGLLAGHPIGYVVMVILLLAGHTFNLIINTLGSYIHSSRLQYIEFYNRFYEGGGRAFVPFRLKTRSIQVQSEWQNN
ncbi:MAG: V-type ATP synthase subunit I [Clostridium sp.]|nr:V-type ATP synthase subunit I [Clostridium sp.]